MLNIYACGGTGINIARQIKDLDVNIFYIDGSDSNLKGVSEDQLFLIPDQDGAGKDRTVTYNNFKNIVEDVLIRFKPSETLNVVISSLSGGSGSVVGPLVCKELISNGQNTIVIGVDSKHSLIEITNSMKTLLTYKSISASTNKCVSLFYVSNTTRKEADQTAVRFINLLSVLVDRKNTQEFDTRDLKNFINFSTVTDNRPSVSILEVGPNQPITPEKGTVVASSILMTSNQDATIYPVVPEYLSTCVVTDRSFDLEDIRLDNVLGKHSLIVETFEQEIQTQMDNKKINKYKEVEISDSTEDGMVL